MKHWIAVAIVVPILLFGAYLVYAEAKGEGVHIPIPGVPWRANVTVDMSRGWWGDPTIRIANVAPYQGFSLLRPRAKPLVFEAEFRLEVTSAVDRSTKVVVIGWNSSKSDTVSVALPDPYVGTKITAKLWNMDGKLASQDEWIMRR